MITLYDRALAFTDLGYSVIPLRWRDKRPDGQALMWAGAVDADGYPTWNPYKERQATDQELRLWFQLSGRRNLGIVTGFNNLTVIDFDSWDAYAAWMTIVDFYGRDSSWRRDAAYRVATSRGMHVYLRTVEPVTSFSIGLVDVKARWGYVLGEDSVHPNGWHYVGSGGKIPTIDQLSDVFPFAPRSDVATDAPARSEYNDPWQSADAATGPIGAGSVAEIKERISVADVLGIAQPRARVMIRCPLHQDATPSFVIYPDGHWHCYGCDRGGDVIDLYAELYGVSVREAIAALQERAL